MALWTAPGRAIRRHPVLGAAALAVVLALVVLEATFFQFHKHFIDDKVVEALPAGAVGAETAPSATGGFVSRSHGTSGTATVLAAGDQRVLRFEGLNTDNGPDLRVYLVAGVTATSPEGQLDDDFVDLGRLKGNIGDQNYDIPAGTDLAKYKTVVIWCKRFSTAFGAADLAKP